MEKGRTLTALVRDPRSARAQAFGWGEYDLEGSPLLGVLCGAARPELATIFASQWSASLQRQHPPPSWADPRQQRGPQVCCLGCLTFSRDLCPFAQAQKGSYP